MSFRVCAAPQLNGPAGLGASAPQLCVDFDRFEFDRFDYDRFDFDRFDFDRFDYDRFDFDRFDYDRFEFDRFDFDRFHYLGARGGPYQPLAAPGTCCQPLAPPMGPWGSWGALGAPGSLAAPGPGRPILRAICCPVLWARLAVPFSGPDSGHEKSRNET